MPSGIATIELETVDVAPVVEPARPREIRIYVGGDCDVDTLDGADTLFWFLRDRFPLKADLMDPRGASRRFLRRTETHVFVRVGSARAVYKLGPYRPMTYLQPATLVRSRQDIDLRPYGKIELSGIVTSFPIY